MPWLRLNLIYLVSADLGTRHASTFVHLTEIAAHALAHPAEPYERTIVLPP
jgi:hypothetical protein